MRRLLCVGLLALFGCCVAAALEASLLPDHFGPWQAESPSTLRSGQGLYEGWGDVKPDGLREAGLRSLETRSYKMVNGELRLNLYTFKDPSGAYQFYTQIVSEGMKSVGLGDESAFGPYNGAILVGNMVVGVGPFSNLHTESLAELVSMLKTKADKTPYPPVRNYLPTKSRIFGSEKYALGPEGFRAAMASLDQVAYAGLAKEVDFESGVEAMLARFRSDRDEGVLLLLDYPTPQLAERHLHHLEKALPATAKQAGVTVERKASLLSVVFAANSKEAAQRLRDEVLYETQVTWNEPSHTATDPPILSILAKIFLYTAMFLGAATGVGIAFGGFRVIIKRLYPGKVFDRPEDIEVLQLGLSGRKIDVTDMY